MAEALDLAGLGRDHAIGQVAHSDPYTAIQNALQFYAPDDIVISTFPETRSGWLRQGLVDRLERAGFRVDAASDVDFLVDFEPGRSLLDLASLLVELEDLLGRPVDIVTEPGLKARIRQRVLTDAVAV